jgi:CRISPR-associated protein Cas1
VNNTLYVTTQGARLRKQGETIVVEAEGERLAAVPLHHLDGVLCFGNVSATPFLLHACAEAGVSVSFMSEYGRFLARVEGPISGNVLLRREQYRRADDASACLEFALAFVTGKLANCRACLRRFSRDHTEPEKSERLSATADGIQATLNNLGAAAAVDEARGHEGEGASLWFAAFDDALHGDPGEFRFERRSRRPPLNRTNALLSFGYSLLTHECSSALQAVGLDPAVGFLHVDRPGRLSLALDLMEEFRPAFVDRFVVSLINQRQMKPDGFQEEEGGAVVMTQDTRKQFLSAWQRRKREEIVHPFTQEKTTLGLVPFIQARLLARVLRGDLKVYPPFSVR